MDDTSAGNIYFTCAYILMTTVILAQAFYYCFIVYSYQSIKKKIVEKGRLLQVIPVISVATVNMPQNQLLTDLRILPTTASTPYPFYTGISRIGNKEIPPPYTP
ncbi:hypothetical protein NQ318_000207 [Aromia moschata]|uniref:Uncharacterized protein n=1 Tax=Aromia moschata TaxID=1265417 RepID=A0AAV8YKR3_9CUCU|nr:hypothetical protein NQ318_000207 [Aromia moschata]